MSEKRIEDYALIGDDETAALVHAADRFCAGSSREGKMAESES